MDYIKAKEAANIMGFSLQAFYRQVRAGTIPHYRIGKTGSIRFVRSEIEAFLAKTKVGQ